MNRKDMIIILILGIMLSTFVMYITFKQPDVIYSTTKVIEHNSTIDISTEIDRIESEINTSTYELRNEIRQNSYDIAEIMYIVDKLYKVRVPDNRHNIVSIPVIESVNKYEDNIIDIIKNSPYSSILVLLDKLYIIESNNTPTAVEPRNKRNFGLCQLNDYWGNRFAKELGTQWYREETNEDTQKLMCKLRVEGIYRSYSKDNPYSIIIGDKIPDIIVYLAHQVGIEGSKQIGRFIVSIDKSIETKNIDSLVNNLDKRYRDRFIDIIVKDGYSKVDQWYLLYLWFNKFNNLLQD